MPATNRNASPAHTANIPAALRTVTGPGPKGGQRAVFKLATGHRGMLATVDGTRVRLINRVDTRGDEEAWSYTLDLTGPIGSAKPVTLR